MSDNFYRHYMLGLLLVMLAFNNVDRLALGLLLQDIKVDLILSDTQLGFLTGIAFALLYALMGIPIARWADRGNRATIITLSAAISSIAVSACGAATNFVQLLMLRMSVAVGEAGNVPPSHSLIADHFDRAERPKAMAIYQLGWPLSLVIGYMGAGWLNAHFGWRLTFVLLGLPGLLLAAAAWFTLCEPRQAWQAARAARGLTEPEMVIQPSFIAACATLWANITFRNLLMAYSVSAFFSSGITQWDPTFFIRTHHLETQYVGMGFGLAVGIGSLVGIPLGGVLASRYAAGNERLQLIALAWLFCSYILISVLKYLAPDATTAFLLLGLSILGVSMIHGPLFAVIQSVVPGRLRAVSVAFLFLFANLIGAGLGPLAVGALSDGLRGWAGEDSLRYALLAFCPGYLWCAWHWWRASRSVAEDLRAAEEATADESEPMKRADAQGATID